MKLWKLSPDEQKRINWVVNWTSRMTHKHGATVYDRNGSVWDWGQALCRECYGEDWNNDPELPDTPSWEDVFRAQEMEKGLPKWIIKCKQ